MDQIQTNAVEDMFEIPLYVLDKTTVVSSRTTVTLYPDHMMEDSLWKYTEWSLAK